jgi:cytoskeletal protein CcmA (bactofilin family)
MVNGHIVAKTKLEITTNGKLKGDIKTGSLIIAEGVLFEGKCQMISEKPEVEVSGRPLAEKDEIQSR